MKRRPPTAGASLAELEGVYRSHFARFLRAAMRLTGERQTGRDVVQEAFARAVRGGATPIGRALVLGVSDGVSLASVEIRADARYARG